MVHFCANINLMANKIEEYDLYIKDGYPPPKAKTRYDTKLPDGALPYIGTRIKPVRRAN